MSPGNSTTTSPCCSSNTAADSVPLGWGWPSRSRCSPLGGCRHNQAAPAYRPIVASRPPDNAAAYAPVDGNGPPRTRHRVGSAHHPSTGFELRCQKAVGSPHRSLVLPPADRLCSRNSPSLAPKTATCGLCCDAPVDGQAVAAKAVGACNAAKTSRATDRFQPRMISRFDNPCLVRRARSSRVG
jgi:hypothetical protein